MGIQYRSTQSVIDLGALRFNIQQIRKAIGQTTQMMGVVKANAYGHGAVQCARVLESEGVRVLAVASVEEGIELRAAGIRGEIIVLDGLTTSSLGVFAENRLKPVLHSIEEVELYGHFAHDKNRAHAALLKFDTGMGRLGLFPSEVDELMDKLRRYAELDIQGIMSHLACADEVESAATQRQIDLFDRILQILETRGLKAASHIANSAAILSGVGLHYSMVRPGLMLYGAYPNQQLVEKMSLKPVMKLKTSILSVKRHPMGNALGYGGTFTTKRESLIGVLPLGYADGYPRLLSNRAFVLVHGQRVPVVGRISMDLVLIDVTEISDVKPGDEVVLIGNQEQATITVEEVAGWAETISYEVMCGISPRVPKIYENA